MVMNLDYILGKIQLLIQSGAGALSEKGRELTTIDTVILAAAAAAGLLFCFFGLKLVRLWAAVLGLSVGFTGGAYLASYFGLEGHIPLIAGAAAGVILAVLSGVLYRAGAFLVVWLMGIAGSACILGPQDWIFVLVCVAIGLVIALITLKFTEPVTMLVTAVFGGALAGQAGYILIPVKNWIIQIAMIAVLAVLGIIVQFLMESKRRKRQHLKKAEEIRQSTSVANEVDKARAMMENLDQAKPDMEETAEEGLLYLNDEEEELADFEDLDEDGEPLDFDDLDEEDDFMDEESDDYDSVDIEEDDDIQILDLDDDE